jgi:hypothetical protein
MHRHAIVDPAAHLTSRTKMLNRLANNKDLGFPTTAHLIPVSLHTPVQPQCSNRRSCSSDAPITPISVLESKIIGLYSMVHTGPIRSTPIAEKLFIRLGGAERLSDRIS